MLSRYCRCRSRQFHYFDLLVHTRMLPRSHHHISSYVCLLCMLFQLYFILSTLIQHCIQLFSMLSVTHPSTVVFFDRFFSCIYKMCQHEWVSKSKQVYGVLPYHCHCHSFRPHFFSSSLFLPTFLLALSRSITVSVPYCYHLHYSCI